MNTPPSGMQPAPAPWAPRASQALVLLPAPASIFHGETLDMIAGVLAWAGLVIGPIAAIVAFLLVHILPEKIAEKKQHPQAKAIQCLCLLSLVFGGLLWPLAWLWAYTRPVFYKMAYGTDTETHGHGEAATPDRSEAEELRKRVAYLEARLAGKTGAEGGKG